MKSAYSLLASLACIGLFGVQAAYAINPQPLPPHDPHPDPAHALSSYIGEIANDVAASGSFAEVSAGGATADSQSTGAGAGKIILPPHKLTAAISSADALDTVAVTAVPEPASAALWLLGLAVIAAGALRRGAYENEPSLQAGRYSRRNAPRPAAGLRP